MEQTIHINVCIPVTITHVKENRKTETVFFVWTRFNCLYIILSLL
jgi:predicted SPOUT superfamily RNA methylase MTH1